MDSIAANKQKAIKFHKQNRIFKPKIQAIPKRKYFGQK